MKILVKADNRNIRLVLPLSLIKSKLAAKLLTKNDPSGFMKEFFGKKELVKKIYKELKKYKGLTLIDVVSEDAKVKITI